MHRRNRTTLSLAVLLMCCGLSTPCVAQWSSAGVTVCGPPCIGSEPLVVSDGIGGCFVAWNDETASPDSFDVYVQHFDASGRRVANWPARGLPIDAAVNATGLQTMVPDGLGGALVACNDHRNPDSLGIYICRVQYDGTLPPGWPVNGVRAMAHFIDNRPQIFADSLGGVFVVVDDFRTVSGPTGPDIYLQHLDATGHPAPGWGVDGKPVALAPGHQATFRSSRDGAGGFYFVWDFDGSAQANVYCQHILASGDPAPGWPTAGKLALPNLGAAGVVPRAGGGATILVGRPGADSPLDIAYYTLGIDADGNRAAPWTSGPKSMVIVPGTQRDMIVVPDGLGGLYGTWMDDRNYSTSASDVYLQRIDTNGDPAQGWPPNGVPAVVSRGFDFEGHTAVDIFGGAYVVASIETSIEDVWVAHLLGTGSVAPGWAPGGQTADASPTNVADAPPAIAADDRGGAFVAFEQRFPGSQGIVVQHFGGDVPVATTASLVAADAFSDHVALDWFVADGSLTSATVERHVESGGWEQLGTIVPDGTGHLRYEDHAVSPGNRYAYRLAYSAGGLLARSPEAWVNVPLLAKFALAGAIPNPAPGRNLRVTFSLPSAQPARLELYDLTGRLVSAREVGTLGTGEHSLQLFADGHVSAGMYWLRLSQASQRATVRIAVVD
jgi:hypothetical protein